MLRMIYGLIKKSINENKDYQRDILNLSCVTRVTNLGELMNRIAPYQMTTKELIKFYSITGRFPTAKEDDLIKQANFNDWYLLSKAGCEGREAGEALRSLINKK